MKKPDDRQQHWFPASGFSTLSYAESLKAEAQPPLCSTEAWSPSGGKVALMGMNPDLGGMLTKVWEGKSTSQPEQPDQAS